MAAGPRQMTRSPLAYVYPTGVAVEDGAYVVTQVMGPDEKKIPGHLVVEHRPPEAPSGWATDWDIVSICRASSGEILCVGGSGVVLVILGQRRTAEVIGDSAMSPETSGPIREIRSLPLGVFAVGMGRQIYRRTPDCTWQPFAPQILDTEYAHITGFTSIVQTRESRLVTVGYGGEIYEYDGNWQKVDTPTNVLLTRGVEHRDNVYAAGLRGTLLRRQSEGWRVVDLGSFRVDIWDLESYGDMLYLGTADGLFRLREGAIEQVEVESQTGQVNCSAISSTNDRIWVFGGRVVSQSKNGKDWSRSVILE